MSDEVHEEKMITSVRSKKYTYTWVLKNFSAWWVRANGRYESFKFPSGLDEKAVQWMILFHPKESKTHSGLYLKAVNAKGNFEVKCKLSMEDSEGITFAESSMSLVHDWNVGRGFPKFIETEKILKAVKPNDQLNIVCKMIAYEIISNEQIDMNLPELLPSRMSKDMGTLVDGTKFGDVSILVAGQRFLAYKGILSARSAVFAAMFEHPMQENKENCITITDVDPEVFKELLRYIYTDELTCLESMAQKLFRVADKYDIPTLKSLCQRHILKKMTAATAAQTLVLADMHGDLEMKRRTLRFLSGCEAGKVTKSAGWKKLVRTHPYLVDNVIEVLATRKTVGK